MSNLLYGIGITATVFGAVGLILVWIRFCVDHIHNEVASLVAVYAPLAAAMTVLFGWISQ